MVDIIHRPGRIGEGLWVCKVFLHRRPKIQKPQFDKSEPEILVFNFTLSCDFHEICHPLVKVIQRICMFLKKFPNFRDMMSCTLVD